RRHTRSYGDWSSDVCSSDLPRDAPPREVVRVVLLGLAEGVPAPLRRPGTAHVDEHLHVAVLHEERIDPGGGALVLVVRVLGQDQIGRASCRERVWGGGGGGA